MVYLYIKIALAILLSTIPFLFAIFIKPKTKNGKWRNLFSLTHLDSESVANGTQKIRNIFKRIYEAMKHSDNARKFFIMLLIITMIIYQWIDSEATQAAVGSIIGNKYDVHQSKEALMSLFPFITSPIVTISSMIYTLILFRYKWSNKLLTKIHSSNKITILLCVIIIVSMIIGRGRFFLLGEILFLTLIWGTIIPKKKEGETPHGGTRIKINKDTYKNDKIADKIAA